MHHKQRCLPSIITKGVAVLYLVVAGCSAPAPIHKSPPPPLPFPAVIPERTQRIEVAVKLAESRLEAEIPKTRWAKISAFSVSSNNMRYEVVFTLAGQEITKTAVMRVDFEERTCARLREDELESKRAAQATNAFGQAKARDTITSYEAYLLRYPQGSGAQEAQARLRELRFADAKRQMTLEAFNAFLKRYSDGPDVDTLNAALPAVRAFEKHRAFGNAILKHAPQTSMRITNFEVTGKTTRRFDPTPEDLAKLKAMLADGADPSAVRVAGFEPPGEEKLGKYAVEHSTGTPGRIVRAEEGGITLLEYCRLNDLKTIAMVLTEHGAK